MFRKIQEARENEEGFTLIELLVVVIIIGILAAIAIPVFLNQRESAWRSSAESDVRNAAIAVETYYTTNDDYPDSTAFDQMVTDGDIQESDGVSLSYTDNDTSFVVQADHDQVDGDGDGTLTGDVDAEYDSSAGGLQ